METVELESPIAFGVEEHSPITLLISADSPLTTEVEEHSPIMKVVDLESEIDA